MARYFAFFGAKPDKVEISAYKEVAERCRSPVHYRRVLDPERYRRRTLPPPILVLEEIRELQPRKEPAREAPRPHNGCPLCDGNGGVNAIEKVDGAWAFVEQPGKCRCQGRSGGSLAVSPNPEIVEVMEARRGTALATMLRILYELNEGAGSVAEAVERVWPGERGGLAQRVEYYR